MNFLSTSTIRKNRLRDCPMTTEKTFKKYKRGSFEYSIVNYKNCKVNVLQWLDGSVVTISSTAHSAFPLDSIKRWDRKSKKIIKVDYPSIIKHYNKKMGGVDLFDMLMAFYRLDHKSKKWYFRIFYWALNLCLINGCLIRKRQCILQKIPKKNTYKLLDFCISVSSHLMNTNQVSTQKKRGRPSLLPEQNNSKKIISRKYQLPEIKISNDVRYDEISHFPKPTTNKVRCKLCSMHSRTVCIKCKVHLCLNNNRNCFLNFHKK